MFLSAGLVLSGCGDDDTATTPAPAPPPPPPPAPEPEPEPEPEPPAPEAPATPTGLHVSDTTPISITWSWDAVEGALGYAVQFSPDEMFDDTDMLGIVLETSFTATPVPPETNVYLRVRAGTGTPEAVAAAAATGDISGLALSDWSTHVTGRTDMVPVPPPPPPAAVSVEFMIPDGEFPMEPDDGTDEESAMASVNNDIMVMSNTTAVITPMFVEDAAGVSIMAADDNMPFAYVDWSALQADVVSDGATFMIQRTTMGANQEMEPTGDVAYVTCGPFACMDGEDPPEISIEDSAVCAGWDPEVEFHVGLVDNDVLNPPYADAANPTEAELALGVMSDDGIDAGWTTTSDSSMSVEHVFAGVGKHGENYEVSGRDASKGTDKSLKMDLGAGTADDADKNRGTKNTQYNPAISIYADDAAEGSDTNASACIEGSTYDVTIGSNHRPDNCFRLSAVNDSANYLEGYRIELAANDSAVGWGDVEWEENPFVDEEGEDLTCESMTFMAMEAMETEICDLFEDEVDQALDGGWGGSRGTVGVMRGPVVTNKRLARGASNKLAMWTVAASGAASDRFKTLWFDDNANGKIAKDGSAERPHRAEVTGGTDPGTLDDVTVNSMHDLYSDNATRDTGGAITNHQGNINLVWQFLSDGDGDPTYGDFGKVDIWGADRTSGDATVNDGLAPDGKADNYDSTDDARACSDDDGEGCDAEWSEDFDILFADGVFGCETTRTVTITCEWDASGGMNGYTHADHRSGGGSSDPGNTAEIRGGTVPNFTFDGFNTGTPTAATRTPGHISAFVKCTAS